MIAYRKVAPRRFAPIRILVICPSCCNSSSKINFWLPLKGNTTFSRLKYDISEPIVSLHGWALTFGTMSMWRRRCSHEYLLFVNYKIVYMWNEKLIKVKQSKRSALKELMRAWCFFSSVVVLYKYFLIIFGCNCCIWYDVLQKHLNAFFFSFFFFLPKKNFGRCRLCFFMKKDEATWGRLSAHEKVKQTA